LKLEYDFINVLAEPLIQRPGAEKIRMLLVYMFHFLHSFKWGIFREIRKDKAIP
jgi:hypothetical protein